MFFRSIASLSRTISQAQAPAAMLILALVIYTGFALPVTQVRPSRWVMSLVNWSRFDRYMHGWSRWINYVDPIAYGEPLRRRSAGPR